MNELVIGVLGSLIASAVVGTLVWLREQRHIRALTELLSQTRSRRLPEFGKGEAFTTPRRAILFTVGGQKETILYVLRAQNPEYIGFVCTEQTRRVVMEIEQDPAFQAAYSKEKWRLEYCDPVDVQDVRDKTLLLFQWLQRAGLSASEMALDPTGGTVIMSLGAFTVSEELGIDSQYVRTKLDRETNKPVEGTKEAVYISRHTTAPAASSGIVGKRPQAWR